MEKIKFFDVTKVTATHLSEMRRRLEEHIHTRSAEKRSVGPETTGSTRTSLVGSMDVGGVVAGLQLFSGTADFLIQPGNGFTPAGDLVIVSPDALTYSWSNTALRKDTYGGTDFVTGETVHVYLRYADSESSDANYLVTEKYPVGGSTVTHQMKFDDGVTIIVTHTSLSGLRTAGGNFDDPTSPNWWGNHIYLGSFVAFDTTDTSTSNFNNVTFALPTLPSNFNFVSATSNPIAGITHGDVSDSVSTGNGEIKYLIVSNVRTLQFTSPGDTIGTAVTITQSGPITLASATTTDTIDVNVEFSLLPSVSQTETITISRLYDRTIPIWSAQDQLHRALQGSGTPTAKNPHGMTVDDLQGALSTEELELHQDLQHTNGISSDSGAGALALKVVLGSGGETERVQLAVSPPVEYYYYINGKRFSSLESNNVSFGATPNDGSELHEIYIDKDRNVKGSKRVKMHLDLDTDQGIEIVNVDPRIGQVAFSLKYVRTSDTDKTLAISTDGGTTYGVSAPLLPNANVYYRIYDQTGVSWVDIAVKWATLPTTSKTTIGSFSTAILRETNLVIAAIVLSKVSGEDKYFLGNLFSESAANTRISKDLRQWGSISQREITDEARTELIELPRLELRSSGVARGLLVSNRSGGVTVAGGIAYLNGKRLEVRKNDLDLGTGTWHIVIPDTGVPAALEAKDVLRFRDRPYRRDAYVLLAIAEVVDGGGTTVTNVPLRIYSLDRKLPTIVVAQKTGEGHFSVEEDSQSAIQRGIDYLTKNSETGGTVFVRRGTYPGKVRIPGGIRLIGEGEDTILSAVDLDPVIADVNDTLNRSFSTAQYHGIPGKIKGSDKIYSDFTIFGSSILEGDTIYIFGMSTTSYGFYTVVTISEVEKTATLFPDIQDAVLDEDVIFARASSSIEIKNLTVNGSGATQQSNNALVRLFAAKDFSISNITLKSKNREGDGHPSHLQLDECYLGSVAFNRIRQPADTDSPESQDEKDRSGLDGILGWGCRHVRFENNIIENTRYAIDLYLGGGCTIARNFIAKCEWGIALRNQSVLSMLAETGGNSPIPSGTLTALTGILPSGPSGIIQIGHMLSALRTLRLTGHPASISDISGISGFFFGLSGPSGITGLSGIRRIRKHPPFRPRKGLAYYRQAFGNPARFGEAPGPGGSITTDPMQSTAAQIAAQEGFSVVAENFIQGASIFKQIGGTDIEIGSQGRAIYLDDTAGTIIANNSIMTYIHGIYLSGAQTTANMFIGNNFDNRDAGVTEQIIVPADIFLSEAHGATSMTSNIFAQNRPPDGQRQLLFADASGILTPEQAASNFRSSNLDFDTMMNLGIDSAGYPTEVQSFTQISKSNAGRFILDFAKAFLAEHESNGVHSKDHVVTSIIGTKDDSVQITGPIQLATGAGTIDTKTSYIANIPVLDFDINENGFFSRILGSTDRYYGYTYSDDQPANLVQISGTEDARITLTVKPQSVTIVGPAILLGLASVTLLNRSLENDIPFIMDVYGSDGSNLTTLSSIGIKKVIPGGGDSEGIPSEHSGERASHHSEFLFGKINSGDSATLNTFVIDLANRDSSDTDLLACDLYDASVSLVVIKSLT